MQNQGSTNETGSKGQSNESMAEAIRQASTLQTVKATVIIPPKGPADLKPDAKILNRVLQMDGEKVARELPAEHQLIADGWRKGSLWGPYLVYMPEKDRLLLLYNTDYTQFGGSTHPVQSPVLSFSDDHGQTWSRPRYLRDMGFCPEGSPQAGDELGSGSALAYLGDGRLIVDTGEFIAEQYRGFSSDYGETWTAEPLPRSSGGFRITTWDPMWVDKDPATGEVQRLCEPSCSSGMERMFDGAERIVVFPWEWHWKYDPEDRGMPEAWYEDESFDQWPRMMRIDKHWTYQGEPGGVGWYATGFEAPETDGAPLAILFGAVDGDCDVFIDGRKVGEQKKPSADMWCVPFHVRLDEGLPAGAHRMVVRVEKECEPPDSNAGIYRPVWIVRIPGPGTPAVDIPSPKNHFNAKRILLRFSYDGGHTWPEELEPPNWTVGSGVSGSEVALCRAANGTLVAGCRIRLPKYQVNNLIDHYAGLGVSLSKDNGYTWTKIKLLYEYGRMHPSMALLPNGDIVMTYVVRTGWLADEERQLDEDGYPQWGIEAVISRDHGESWDLTHKYVLAKWSGASHAQSTSTVLMPDGSLLTAFSSGYLSRPADQGLQPQEQEVCLVRWRP